MATKHSSDPTKRIPTRHRGISYRVRQGGGRTYYVFHAGNYVAVPGGAKEALAEQARVRNERANGVKPVTDKHETTGEVLEEWYAAKQRSLRPSTAKEYRRSIDQILVPKFGSRKIGSIESADIARLIRDLEDRGLKGKTVKGETVVSYLKPLMQTFAFAVTKRYIASNPYLGLAKEERPVRRDDEKKGDHEWQEWEIDAIISTAKRLARQPECRRDYTPPITLTFRTGLRESELLGLRWEDMTLPKKSDPKQLGELRVRRQWLRSGEYGPLKTAAAKRDLVLGPELVEMLRAHREKAFAKGHASPEHPVFAGRDGKPFQHRPTTKGFERIAELAGVEGVSWHSMRHAFASRQIAKGTDPVKLARMLGHKSTKMTLDRYSHLYDAQSDETKEAMAL